MDYLLKPRIAIFDFWDVQASTGAGRRLAERLTARLRSSNYYNVIARSEWRASLPGKEYTQEGRFHGPWAAHAGKLAELDGVIIGRLAAPTSRNVGNVTVMIALLDTATGEVAIKVALKSVDGLARALDSAEVASKIQLGQHPVRARIIKVRSDEILLNKGTSSGLPRGGTVEVHRILETVPDPYYPQNRWPVDCLSARIGEAKVLIAGPNTSLACYEGSSPPRVGDLTIQVL
jgi:hypothetical protein